MIKTQDIQRVLSDIWVKYRVLRYLFSGGTGFVVNVSILYILTDIFRVWYVISGAIAFLVSITVSFVLHRTFTFNYEHTQGVKIQYAGFVGVSLLNLLVNEGVLIFAVEVLDMWYVLGQTLGSVVVAFLGYFVYRYVVFQEKRITEE